MHKIYLPFIFIILSVTYFIAPSFSIQSQEIFLTVSTFLFAIFAGFFMSRQGRRYSAIREHIAQFDGAMSFVYRSSGHISKQLQKQIGSIIKKHYLRETKAHTWDYNFMHKTTTLTDIHIALEKAANNKKLLSLKNLALSRILAAMAQMQTSRKSLVSLHQERIPFFQWLLLYILAFILLVTVSVIPSQFVAISALLKGAFASATIFVLFLLHKFDRLSFFENTIGERSAHDVLEIIAGKK